MQENYSIDINIYETETVDKRKICGERKWANEWRKTLVRSFDFILGTTAALYGRIFDLHRNGIYATLSEGNNNNNSTGTG